MERKSTAPQAGDTALRLARELAGRIGETSLVEQLEKAQPTAGETYDAAQASRAKARGTYRGKLVDLLIGGEIRVQGIPGLFGSVQEATAAIDEALDAT
jgi:hypothetical protein